MNELNQVGLVLLENWKDITLLTDTAKSGIQPLMMKVCIKDYRTCWFTCIEHLTTLALLTHVS